MSYTQKSIGDFAKIKETDYAYAVAFVRTLENKMLRKADFEALLNASSGAAVARLLLDKGYGGNGGQNFDAEELPGREMCFIRDEVKAACPKGAPVDIPFYQNDFHNLKAILKAVFSGDSYGPLMLAPCTIPTDGIYSAVLAKNFEKLPNMFKKCAAEAYRLLAAGDTQRAEVTLDKAYFTFLAEAAKRLENDFLIEWVDLNVALMNMRIALRCAKSAGRVAGESRDRNFLRFLMIDCHRVNIDRLISAAIRDEGAVLSVFEQSGFSGAAEAAKTSTANFEAWCDNRLITFAAGARHKTFGFEPILSFLILKQFEIQSVRIILGGAAPEVLRERLRDYA